MPIDPVRSTSSPAPCEATWDHVPLDVKCKIARLLSSEQLKQLRLISRESMRAADMSRDAADEALAAAWDRARESQAAPPAQTQRPQPQRLAVALGDHLAAPRNIAGGRVCSAAESYSRLQRALTLCKDWPSPGVNLEQDATPEATRDLAEKLTFVMAWPRWAHGCISRLCQEFPIPACLPVVLDASNLHAVLISQDRPQDQPQDQTVAVRWGYDRKQQPFVHLETVVKSFELLDGAYHLTHEHRETRQICRFFGQTHLSANRRYFGGEGQSSAFLINPENILAGPIRHMKRIWGLQIEVRFPVEDLEATHTGTLPGHLLVEHLRLSRLNFCLADATILAQNPQLWPRNGERCETNGIERVLALDDLPALRALRSTSL